MLMISASELLADSSAVLFDFDGPVCSVFASYSPSQVAFDVIAAAERAGVLKVGQVVTSHPMELINASLTRAQNVWCDSELSLAEVQAVKGAVMTLGAHALITALFASGKPLAVVSNNSTQCLKEYWRTCALPDIPLVGRQGSSAQLMKPDPHALRVACEELKVSPSTAVMIGDSVTDIISALALGMKVVGYANKPGKESVLRAAGATAIITCMTQLKPVLTA